MEIKYIPTIEWNEMIWENDAMRVKAFETREKAVEYAKSRLPFIEDEDIEIMEVEI